MTVTGSAVPSTLSVGTLSANGCKARYGVAYVRAICSQAGVPFYETSPDEDVLAVDGLVKFDASSVAVQIKCTSQFKIKGHSATWPAEVEWREKWNKSKTPVYFVLVIVEPSDEKNWLLHSDAGTMHRSAAFWTRVDGAPNSSGIYVPKNQRLTAATLDHWLVELDACFAPAQGLLP